MRLRQKIAASYPTPHENLQLNSRNEKDIQKGYI